MNLYLFAVKEHASDETLQMIEDALTPPVTMKIGDAPVWYGSDEDAWSEFSKAMRT